LKLEKLLENPLNENKKKINKDIKRIRRKSSKPIGVVKDKNFSSKFTQTERNKQKRRKLQMNFERKVRLVKKRQQDMDNVEKYVAELDDEEEKAKKRLERREVRKKLAAFRIKHLRRRYFGVPNSALLQKIPTGSLRTLKPYGHEFIERTARYEQRNMVIC